MSHIEMTHVQLTHAQVGVMSSVRGMPVAKDNRVIWMIHVAHTNTSWSTDEAVQWQCEWVIFHIVLLYGTWLIHIWEFIFVSVISHIVLLYGTWLFITWDMTHSFMNESCPICHVNESFIGIWEMTHWDDSSHTYTQVGVVSEGMPMVQDWRVILMSHIPYTNESCPPRTRR